MSWEQENNHGTSHVTTHGDAVPQGVALLLADAADAVEIGAAPYQAVVRGGRRRKTRRWAVAAVAVVVIAGSTGTLALSGVMDGDGGRVSPATGPHTAEERHVYKPQRTTLGTGRDSGEDWKVTVDVWGAPRNEVEADRQYEAMGRTYKVSEVVVEPGSRTPTAPDQSKWIGKSRLYVRLTAGGQSSSVTEEAFAVGVPSGGNPKTYTTPLFDPIALSAESDKLSDRQLVIGKVAPTAQQVRVTWSDGTTTEINRDEDDTGDQDRRTPRLLDAEGSSMSWFVVLAPKGLSHDSTEVSR